MTLRDRPWAPWYSKTAPIPAHSVKVKISGLSIEKDNGVYEIVGVVPAARIASTCRGYFFDPGEEDITYEVVDTLDLAEFNKESK